jgi:hypothetical protein
VPEPPAPGLFEAPLRQTGLFEAPPTEAGVVDLRPFESSAEARRTAPALPRRLDRNRRPANGLDATQPHPVVPEAAASATDEPAPDRAPGFDHAERVVSLFTDDSTSSSAEPPQIPLSAQDPSGRPQLPRRTRQSHLSPKLRDLPAADAADPTTSSADLPDAEEARSRMSALQRGTLRGRATDPEA